MRKGRDDRILTAHPRSSHIQWEEELIDVIVDHILRGVSVVTVADLMCDLLLLERFMVDILHVNDIQNASRHE